MANELEKAVTIKTAIDRIDAGDFLLPSIQRRFVWNTVRKEMNCYLSYEKSSKM